MRRRINPSNRRSMRFESLESRTLLTTLAISEINYNPYQTMTQFGDIDEDSDKFEFIELKNVGDEPVALAGIRFVMLSVDGETEGVGFEFSEGTLNPDEHIVVVENLAAFQSRYGNSVRVAGAWSGGLSDNGEQITLLDTDSRIIEQFSYDSNNKWPSRADGLGAALERKDFDLIDPNDPDAWRSSVEYGGTPGDAPGDRTTTVIINELLAHTDLPEIDIVELYNPTLDPIDVSGWYMTDNIDAPVIFAMPEGSVIPADGYLLIDENAFNPDGEGPPNGYALSEAGEELWLLESDGGRPTRFADRVEFPASINGVSLGNVNNVDDRSELQPLQEPTFGEPNGSHREGEVIITEVQYHPPDDDVYKEYIEIRNTTVFSRPIGNWRITDAIDLTIAEDVIIGGNETLVIVPFDPHAAVDAEKMQAFRDYYGIDETVSLIGPWDTDKNGNPDALSNGGEKITWNQPHEDLDEILLVPIDQVDFNDKLPWPTVADGAGGAIERLTSESYGNDPASWTGRLPSPGNQPIDLSNSPELILGQSEPGDIGMDGEWNRGAADIDVFRFAPTISGGFQFSTSGQGDMPVDTYLRVFDSAERELSFSDNHSEETLDSRLSIQLEANAEYYVVVTSSSDTARDFNPFTGEGAVAGNSLGPYELAVEADVNSSPWQNAAFPEDVDGDGEVIPLDALIIINRLNDPDFNPELEPPTPGNEPPPYIDVDGDNFLFPFDALRVINYLNRDQNSLAAVATENSSLTGSEVETHSLDHELLAGAVDQFFIEDENPFEKNRRAK